MAAILLIEDDLTFSKILEGFLIKNNFTVTVAHKGKGGLSTFNEKRFDLVLLDYRLPDMTGMEVLTEIMSVAPKTPVIIMTSFSDIRTAIKAIKAGALEYITKPVNPDELLMLIQQGLKKESKLVTSPKAATLPNVTGFIKGKSELSEQLHEHIKLVAPTDMSVFIEGESGTGKEYVARTIHRLSKRVDAPFIAVDCGALSKDLAASELFGHIRGAFTGAMNDKMGQFEAAHGGTLFLDEVGNLSYEVQVKLLRALQERIIQPIGSNKEVKVDVRIITATNEDLGGGIRNGSFREDLYHRINEFKLIVPPLRMRKNDIMEFIEHFRNEASLELGRKTISFHPEVISILKTYDWPGNLRELKNTVKRAVLLSSDEVIGIDTLPKEMIESIKSSVIKQETPSPEVYDLKALQETKEREMIMKTLLEVKYNKSKAARILNIDRKTLYLKMERYGIE